jgi:hypothetical protein
MGEVAPERRRGVGVAFRGEEVEAFTIEATKQTINVKASTWTTVPVVRAVAGAHGRTQLGIAGILAMHAGLLLFGWIYTVFSAVILVTVGLLLRAQWHADRGPFRPLSGTCDSRMTPRCIHLRT